MSKILFLSALVSLVGIALIGFFILINGLPLIQQVGIVDFVFNSDWSPLQESFGILTMIVGSITVTLGAIIIAVPLALGGATFLSEFAPPRIRYFF